MYDGPNGIHRSFSRICKLSDVLKTSTKLNTSPELRWNPESARTSPGIFHASNTANLHSKYLLLQVVRDLACTVLSPRVSLTSEYMLEFLHSHVVIS